MFLQRLTLENIRSIPEAALDFANPDQSIRRWTCLLGENGTGKSSILRAAALILAGSEGLPDLLGDPSRWVRNGRKSACITARIQTQEGETRDISLILRRNETLTETLKNNEQGLQLLDNALRHSQRSYFTAGFGVSRRLPGPDAERFRAAARSPRAASVGTLFQNDTSLRSVESWAMDLHYRRGATGLSMIREAMNSVLPGIKFLGIEKEARQLLFETPDGKVPLSQLSDGFQNVIAWFGDLLFRITEVFTDYKKPLTARGLLLLDEADLHLHPVWQRRVADYLLKLLPNFQFLVTTHSALTAQQCGEGELFLLKREGKIPKLQHYTGAPNLLRIDQLLVSPVFGLKTGLSLEVQEARDRKNRTPQDVELLRQMPRPRTDVETEKEKIALLKEVKAALKTKPGAEPPRKRGREAAAAARSAEPAPYRVRPSSAQLVASALKAK